MWSEGGRKNEERERGMPPSYIGWDEQRNLLTLPQGTFFLKLCRSHVRHTKWKLSTAFYQNLHCISQKEGEKARLSWEGKKFSGSGLSLEKFYTDEQN